MAYATTSYNEVMAWCGQYHTYAISTDNGKTWTHISDDAAKAWYEAQGYNGRTSPD